MILASCTGMLTLDGCVQRHVHVHTTADHDHTNLVQACASGVVFGGGSTELVVIQIQCVNLCTGAFDTFDSWTPDSGILGTVLQHKAHVGGRSGIQGQDTVSHFVRMLSCRVSSCTACCSMYGSTARTCVEDQACMVSSLVERQAAASSEQYCSTWGT